VKQLRTSVGRAIVGAGEAFARAGLPADAPEVLRFLAGMGWRAQFGVLGERDVMLREEARRTFGAGSGTLAAIAREAHDLAAQSLLEAALVPRMSEGELESVLRVRGLVRPPAVVTWASTGPRAFLARALARALPKVVLFRSRGQGWVERARREDDSRVPVVWEEDPERLSGWVERGYVLAGAWDDRGWGSWIRESAFGRTLLLPSPLFEIAARSGSPLVHATLVRERDKRWVLTFRPPAEPDPQKFLASEAEPFLRAHPGHWAGWLARCAGGARAGEPPLFEG
jgi:hypothetical protein